MRVELPIVSFIGALLALIPLPWHWRTRNVCTASIFLWLAISNIHAGINTILWRDNVDVKYTIWCDIVIKIQVSSNVGVPASVVCICRRLAHACSPYHGILNVEGKRQRMTFEIGMCLVLPVVVMFLHVTVQIYRFQLNEGFGCSPIFSHSAHNLSPPALAVHGVNGIALRWLIHRRAQFLQATPYAEPVPVSGRYIRAVALAVTQMTVSMEYIHENWREINVVPKTSEPELMQGRFMATWYFVPTTSAIVFTYFGPGSDTRVAAEYRHMFTWIRVHIFRIRSEKYVAFSLSRADATPAGDALKTNNVMADVVETDDISTSRSDTIT